MCVCVRVCAMRTKVGYTWIYDRICENRPLRVIQIVQYTCMCIDGGVLSYAFHLVRCET